ncbi:MAG: TOBE domain-containing protein, partial [Myxococcota bacterium]
TIGVRPEHFELSTESGQWSGVVGVTERLGSDTFLHVKVEGIGPVTARASGDTELGRGDRVWLTLPTERIHRFGTDGAVI